MIYKNKGNIGEWVLQPSASHGGLSILQLYLNSGINSRIPSIAQFMDLAFSCLVWSCEASGKAQTSIESPPETRVLQVQHPMFSKGLNTE